MAEANNPGGTGNSDQARGLSPHARDQERLQPRDEAPCGGMPGKRGPPQQAQSLNEFNEFIGNLHVDFWFTMHQLNLYFT